MHTSINNLSFSTYLFVSGANLAYENGEAEENSERN